MALPDDFFPTDASQPAALFPENPPEDGEAAGRKGPQEWSLFCPWLWAPLKMRAELGSDYQGVPSS